MGASTSKMSAVKNKNFQLEVLGGHTGGINVMALSEDGSVLATGSDDRTIRIWTTHGEGSDCMGVLIGHEEIVYCLIIDENYVISGSSDRTIRKWDISTCRCVHVFRGHKSIINRVFSTGDFIFSSSYDRTARCWDFDTGECIRVFIGHKRGVYPMAFVPGDDDENPELDEDREPINRDILITGSADHTAIAWSFESGRPLNVFKEHSGAVTYLATDPSGKILLTGSTDHTIRSWNISKGERLRVFEGHQSSVLCLTVVNKLVYSGSSDHTARSWVIEFGDCARIYRGHQHTISCVKYKDGFVFTASGDGNAMCFGAKSGSLLRTFKGHEVGVNAMQIADGKLFTASHDKTLRIWDISGIREETVTGRGLYDDEIGRNENSIKSRNNDDVFVDEDENMNEYGKDRNY